MAIRIPKVNGGGMFEPKFSYKFKFMKRMKALQTNGGIMGTKL